MNMRVTFKTPNALEEAMSELPQERREEGERVAKKWIRWGEYVTLEFDLERETVRVVTAGR